MTGMGGYRTLVFRVIGKGEGNLKLFLTRFDPDQIEDALYDPENLELIESEIAKVIKVKALEYEVDGFLFGERNNELK